MVLQLFEARTRKEDNDSTFCTALSELTMLLVTKSCKTKKAAHKTIAWRCILLTLGRFERPTPSLGGKCSIQLS